MQRITESQIQDLYKFTRQHYVEYYDVQTELVDHLANGIEAQWQKEPNLSFDAALKREFKKFGVFGFMDVLEQKTKAMSKIYFKLLLKFAREWFKLPKIALTLTVFLLVQWSMSFSKTIFLSVLLVILVVCLIGIFNLKFTYKKRAKQQGKKWLFESIIFQTAGFNSMMFFVNLFNVINLTDLPSNKLFALIVSVLITVLIIGSYITIIVFPKKASHLLKQQYPEYNFA